MNNQESDQASKVKLEHMQDQIFLPKPQFNLIDIFTELRSLSKERLDTQENEEEGQSIKGLKFISAKLAKLFSKNRKLPYNQISKILIDNFASEQKDQRNIKRRVYDAINVLVAAQVFQKRGNFIEMQKNKIKFKKEGQKKQDVMNLVTSLKQIMITKKQRLSKLRKQLSNLQKLINRNQNLKLSNKNCNSQNTIQGVKMVILATDNQSEFPSENVQILWEGAQNSSIKKSSRSRGKQSKHIKSSKQKVVQSLQILIQNTREVQIRSFPEAIQYVTE